MSLSLDAIVARVEDPDAPLVWLDPSTSEALWRQLPGALRLRGFQVYELDCPAGIANSDSLLNRLGEILPLPEWYGGSWNALKDSLLGMEPGGGKGVVMIFRNPEALRQNDEGAFEDLSEVLDAVHEIRTAQFGQIFKLVVAD